MRISWTERNTDALHNAYDKIVIPKILQQEVLKVVKHDRHLRVVKTKQILGSKVYWWDKEVDKEVFSMPSSINTK